MLWLVFLWRHDAAQGRGPIKCVMGVQNVVEACSDGIWQWGCAACDSVCMTGDNFHSGSRDFGIGLNHEVHEVQAFDGAP